MSIAIEAAFCPGTAGTLYRGGFDVWGTRPCGDRRTRDRAASRRYPVAAMRQCGERM